MAVYGAGFLRTRAAAAKFSDAPAMRRPVAVMPPPGGVALAAPVAQIAPLPAPAAQTTTAAPPASDRRAPATTTDRDLTPKPAPAAAATTSTPLASAPPATAVPPAAAPAAAASSLTAAAPAPVADAATAPAADTTAAAATPRKYKDGVYLGYGTSRHGDIQAQIVIANDRIISASISKCLTQYSCDWIAPLVPQVVQRQSAEVDYVSGATQSTNAFYYAVLEALSIARNR